MSKFSSPSTVQRTPYGRWLRLSQLPFGRTLAVKLIDAGLLDSVLVQSPGSRRGVRLISVESLEAYLKSLSKPRKEATK